MEGTDSFRLLNLQDGMGDKITMAMQNVSTLIAGLAIGFSSSWKLSLVVLACAPFLVIIMAFLVVRALFLPLRNVS